MSEAKRDQWGRYLVTPAKGGGKPRGYTRVTTVAKTLDDGGGLMPWKATATVVGALRRPGLMARWQALLATNPDPWYDGGKDDCKRLVEECTTAGGSTDRADIGTALHQMTEEVDAGRLDPASLLPGMRADIEAYRATMDRAGVLIDPRYIEALVILDEYEVAGTADRLRCKLPDGRIVVGDVKTGTDLKYSAQSIAVQLAAYAHANAVYDQESEARAEMPKLDQDVALVIHLPAGEARCELLLIDIAAGWQAFERSMWARGWRKERNLLVSLGTAPATYRVPTASASAVTNPAPSTTRTVDEGQTVGADKMAALIAQLTALPPEQMDTIHGYAHDANAAGLSISLSQMPTERRYQIAVGLLAMAACGDLDVGDSTGDVTRALLAGVLGDESAKWPTLPVGGLFAHVGLVEARAFAALAAGLAAGDWKLDYSAAGVPIVPPIAA